MRRCGLRRWSHPPFRLDRGEPALLPSRDERRGVGGDRSWLRTHRAGGDARREPRPGDVDLPTLRAVCLEGLLMDRRVHGRSHRGTLGRRLRRRLVVFERVAQRVRAELQHRASLRSAPLAGRALRRVHLPAAALRSVWRASLRSWGLRRSGAAAALPDHSCRRDPHDHTAPPRSTSRRRRGARRFARGDPAVDGADAGGDPRDARAHATPGDPWPPRPGPGDFPQAPPRRQPDGPGEAGRRGPPPRASI